MDAKIVLIFIGIINYVNSAGLLRTPKVYNAVITTDENLTPSRAFPVIQPTIHETGIATYPFGPFNPYRFYNPSIVHFIPPPIPHGLIPKEQIPVPQSPPQDVEPEYNPEHRMLPPSDLGIEMEPQQQNQPSQNNEAPTHEEKPSIPLNEFGLPPSLVPLQSQPPITLQPYTYNHYPLIFEPSFQRYTNPYLPHYGHIPPHTYGIRPPLKKIKNPSSLNPQNNKIPHAPSQSVSNSDSSSKNSELDNIKNGTANKNSQVPDVPPPPLPTSTKTSE